MRVIQKCILAVALTGALAAIGTVGAQAQGSQSCATPGTVSFPEFAIRRGDIAPSLHRQISGLGRMADAGGCDLQVTCVAPARADNTERQTRNRQCTAAVQALVRYETRSPVRDALMDSIKQVKASSSGSLRVGTVYITLR